MPTAEKHISKAPPLTLTIGEVAAIMGGAQGAYRIPTRWVCDTYRLDPEDVAAFVGSGEGER